MLTVEQKEKLNGLDFMHGGGFFDYLSSTAKAKPTDNKVLFIGLGGKGCTAVAQLKTEISRQMEVNPVLKRPRNFEYLLVDTAENDLEQLKMGGGRLLPMSDGANDQEICSLYDGNAAAALHEGPLAPGIKEWINPALRSSATLTGKGANGIRQAGRYLLFNNTVLNRLTSLLKAKLTRLHNQIVPGRTPEQKLLVYIIAGVGGGTGSGTVIDIPYIIRELCRTIGPVKIYGYIFLPDTYERNDAHIRYNSYAALKEIDYLMSLEWAAGGSFHAEYAPNFTVNSRENIFDSCVLVSGRNDSGAIPNPERYSRRVAVDNIINLVRENYIKDSTGNNQFLVSSFLDNELINVSNKIAALPPNVPRDAHYRFMIIGIGALALPMEQMCAYVAWHTFQKMLQAWDCHPNQNDVQSWLARMQMDPASMRERILNKSTTPVMTYTKGLEKVVLGKTPNKEDVVAGTLESALKGYWMNYNVGLYADWDKARAQVKSDIITTFMTAYRAAFQAPDEGIYYLKGLLADRVLDGDRIDGIIERIKKDYLGAIDGLKAGEMETQAQLKAQMQELKTAVFHVPGGFDTPPWIKDFSRLAVGSLNCDNYMALYDDIRRDIMEIVENLKKRKGELQMLADVFAYLYGIVDRNYQCVMQNQIAVSDYETQLLQMNDGSPQTANITAYLDGLVAAKNPVGLVTGLEVKVLENASRWFGTEGFDPAGVFVEYLMGQYAGLAGMTMDSFLTLKYGNLNTGLTQIFGMLRGNAKVIFPSTPILTPLTSLSSHCYLSVPGNDPGIVAAANAWAAAEGATVAMSDDWNHMYWYNRVSGVPLFNYDGLENLEREYEAVQNPGLHIWESGKENWKSLPALLNRALWPRPNFNLREREIQEKAAEDAARFQKLGLIWDDPQTQTWNAVVLPEDDPGVTPDKLEDWCRNTYLAAADTAQDVYDSGKDFLAALRGEFALEEYLLSQALLVQLPFGDAATPARLLRMNWLLYERLTKTCEVLGKCRSIIEEENRKILDRKKKAYYEDAFFDLVRTGIIKIGDKDIHSVDQTGNEEEIMYYMDYSGCDAQHFLYTACRNLEEMAENGKLDVEQLLTESAGVEQKGRNDSKVQKALDENERKLLSICSDMRGNLITAATKRQFQNAGKESFRVELLRFYMDMEGRKRGVQYFVGNPQN